MENKTIEMYQNAARKQKDKQNRGDLIFFFLRSFPILMNLALYE